MRTFRTLALAVVAAGALFVAPPHPTTTPIADVEGGGWLASLTCAGCVAGGAGLLLLSPEVVVATLGTDDGLMLLAGCAMVCYGALSG